jgi:BAAT / Acyl-CoA thioester hydrolase C terminal
LPLARLRDWTLGGAPLPFLEIPVEQINGPVLVVGAGRDTFWPSSIYVRNVELRMGRHRRRDVTALVHL